MAGNDLDPDLLPVAREQAWVMERLAALVACGGAGFALRAPWIEAKAEYFPDSWAQSRAAIRRLLARLLVYSHPRAGLDGPVHEGDPDSDPMAALPEIVVHVQPRDLERRDPSFERPDGPGGRSIDAWIVDNNRKRIEIGIELAALDDPLRLISGLCRVAAHRFCLGHGLVRTVNDHFDATIDIAAVYLGFGVLALDAADWRKSPAPGQKPERTRQGAADTTVIAYALAALCQARGYSERGQRQISGALQPNQAAFLTMACKALVASPAGLASLGLPAREAWPPERSLQRILAMRLPAALQIDTPELDVPLPEEKGIVGANRGKPVFCVDRSLARRVFKFAISFGFLASMLTRSAPDLEIDTGLLVAWAAGGVAVATLIGSLIRERRCSDPKCDAKLTRDAKQCPRCEGDVRGVINNPNLRLEMAEKFTREHADAEVDA